MAPKRLFRSFFMGGFECSTHRTRGGRRLDVVAATAHDRFTDSDYARLKAHGMETAREGVRWHLIEERPGHYDFSSVLPILRAAREKEIQVIWDLCHYGWPDDLDIFSPAFVRRFARFARAFVRFLADDSPEAPLIAPINEISFFSWACGEVGCFYPYEQGRGDELKTQLVRAAIEGIEAIRDVSPEARIAHIDPLVNVVVDHARPWLRAEAEGYRRAQFAAWDMIAGRLAPQLGGRPEYLDLIGVNYYPHNQWLYPERTMIWRDHPLYRPFGDMLREVYARYERPLFIAETGIENDERPGWLRYVCEEVRAAMKAGVPVEGICLYPVVNHPGWDDDRHCHNGLWDYPDEEGEREVCEPLSAELRQQMRLFSEMRVEEETAPHVRYPLEAA